MKKIIIISLAIMVCGLFTGCKGGSDKILIGVSLPTLREERWNVDKRGFEEAAAKLGVEVSIQIADNDGAKQLNQIETMITQGVKALIIAPHDATAARRLVEIAHEDNIPVIAYDRPISGGNADLFICVDQFEIGRAMGQHILDNAPGGNIVFLMGDAADYTVYPMRDGSRSVLQPKVDDGTYTIVMEQHVIQWSQANAMRLMEQALTANNNQIHGVIAPNDGTAAGVIQALEAQGLAGQVPVTGQDAEVNAIRRIIAGTQGMTILYDNLKMSEAALLAAIRLINGEDPGATGVLDDGTPVIDFPPGVVTIDSYRELLIDSGLIDEQALQ